VAEHWDKGDWSYFCHGHRPGQMATACLNCAILVGCLGEEIPADCGDWRCE